MRVETQDLDQVRAAVRHVQTIRRETGAHIQTAFDAVEEAKKAFTKLHLAAIELETVMEVVDERVEEQVNDEWYVPKVQQLMGEQAHAAIYGDVETNTLSKPAMLTDIGIARAIVWSYVVGHAYKPGVEAGAKQALRDATILFAGAMAEARCRELLVAHGHDVTKSPRYVIAQGMVQRIVASACVPLP